MVGGRAGTGRAIRWAHVSELKDPTPFLRGGEVLLTTGLGMKGGLRAQEQFVRRLADGGLAGLGLGLGFGFGSIPEGVAGLADAMGFPVFEVPFEVPFIAITEALASRLMGEQYLLLQRAGTVQRTLSRLLLEEAGLDALLGAYARMTGVRALLFDPQGEVLAASPGAAAGLDLPEVWEAVRVLPPTEGEFPLPHAGAGHRSLLPVVVAGSPAAFLVLARDDRPGPLHQVVAHHIVTAVGLELAKQRAVALTERRLVGDFLDALLDGELSDSEAVRRLRFLGIGQGTPIAVLVATHRVPGAGGALEALERSAADQLSRRQARFASTIHEELVVVLFDAVDAQAAAALAAEIARGVQGNQQGSSPCFALGAPQADPRGLRRAYAEAVFALRAAGQLSGDAPVARVEDLGNHRLLLALQEDAALEALARGLLGEVRAYDARHGGELGRSVVAFLEHNGSWEAAARAICVHRHTLRYRIRRVEELTGLDLSTAGDRVELWLALRAEEVLTSRRAPRPG